ncbi:MAG: hypothetical protein H6557_12220 [Lewinellaceae bacterium]|nr:hypothetical protein [Phaeodactylibacter sp.]MCB9037374.1 hypothetical protein [Lewinellaceae bacterium]
MIKSILKFFALFCLGYFLLLFCFSITAVEQKTSSLFSSTAEAATKTVLSERHLYFQYPEGMANPNYIRVAYETQANIDKQFEAARQKQEAQPNIAMRTYTFFFREFVVLPFIFLLALVAATPLPFKKRLYGLLGGSLLFAGYTYLRISGILAYELYAEKDGQGIAAQALEGFVLFLQSTGASFIVAIFIWILLFFQIGGWQRAVNAITSLNAGTAPKGKP